MTRKTPNTPLAPCNKAIYHNLLADMASYLPPHDGLLPMFILFVGRISDIPFFLRSDERP